MSLEDVKIVSTKSISDSIYIKPNRVNYVQAGKEKIWDYIEVHDSVAILIFNISSQSVVLVRQFRPAVYMSHLKSRKLSGTTEEVSGSFGVTYELCAGLIDRDDSAENIACSEVLEETGYKITPDQLIFINKFRSVGVSGNIQYLFFVEVNDDMKVTAGGGSDDEDELIELFHLKLSDVKSFLEDENIDNRPSGLLYALTWFLMNRDS